MNSQKASILRRVFGLAESPKVDKRRGSQKCYCGRRISANKKYCLECSKKV